MKLHTETCCFDKLMQNYLLPTFNHKYIQDLKIHVFASIIDSLSSVHIEEVKCLVFLFYKFVILSQTRGSAAKWFSLLTPHSRGF
jgi:hypothetical protein